MHLDRATRACQRRSTLAYGAINCYIIPTMSAPDSHRPDQTPPDSRTSRLVAVAGPVVITIALTVLTVVMGMRHNDFPVGYHADEASKAQQILTGEYNFYHPLLLLNATRALHAVTGGADSEAGLVLTGRRTSALFAGAAVLCLMLAIHLLYNERAALAVGLSVAFCPILITHAHYMKEDTSLLFGLSAAFLALAALWRFGQRWLFAAVGVAAALAISSKYVGVTGSVAAVGLCAVYAWRRGESGGRWRRIFVGLALFALGFIAGVVVINHQVFLHPLHFWEGIAREGHHVAEGHGGILISSAPRFTFGAMRDNMLAPVWAMAALWVGWSAARWRRLSAVERALLVFPFAWLVMVLFSRVQFARYLIPAIVCLHLMAGLGVWIVAHRGLRCGKRWMIAAGVAAGLVLWTVQAIRCVDYLTQFHNDSRKLLAAWCQTHLGADDVVMQESYVNLPIRLRVAAGKAWKFIPIHQARFAAAFKTLEKARSYGITHLIVSSLAYDRYIDPNREPNDEIREEFEQRRAFYQRLFREGKLLWEHTSETPVPGPTNPNLRVYRIQRSTGRKLHLSARPGESNPQGEKKESPTP